MSDLAPATILQMVLNPSQQARELQGALSSASGIPGSSGVEIPPPSFVVYGRSGGKIYSVLRHWC